MPEVQVDAEAPKAKENECAVSSPAPSESEMDARTESWLDNIRLIEHFREAIRHHLDAGDYDKDDKDEEDGDEVISSPKSPQNTLSPIPPARQRSVTPAESDTSEPLYPLLKPLAL